MTRASEWAERVAAWRASGKSAGEYCAGRDSSPKTLQWWASRLRRKQARQVDVSPPGAPSTAAPGAAVRLARVVRGPALAPARENTVVVQFGDARVEVASGADRATLALVFEALSMAAGGAR